jgi:hypothetical protein
MSQDVYIAPPRKAESVIDADPLDPRRWQMPARTECVCGGAIVATTWLPHDIVYAVQRHQIEPIHLSYDLLNGIPLASWQLIAGPTLGERSDG